MLSTLILNKQHELADVVRILIYKEDSSILTKVDLDDNEIFIEPILMAYFNRHITGIAFPDGMLLPLMQGYLLEKQELNIDPLCNANGIAYVPTLGYYKKGETTPFEGIYRIPEIGLEVVKYNAPLLQNVLDMAAVENPIEDGNMIIGKDLFDQNIVPLTSAITYIKNNVSDFYALLEMCLKKCTFYKLKGRYSRTFASIKGNGCIFFAIPEEKDVEDEVYFIDMLGFYTGKIIHTTLYHNQKETFKIDYRALMSDVVEVDDHRNLYTLYSNLFTNICACICLESCLDSEAFSDAQKQDVKARMALYLKKYEVDIKKVEALIAHFSGIENIFIEDGIPCYNFMVNQAKRIMNKNAYLLEDFDFSDFYYRMGFAEFSRINS